MITKYTSGTPIRTDAVVKDFAGIDINKFPVDYKIIDGKFIFSFDMQDSDIVFGLGEAPRGINKRGWIYESFCSDDPFHTEKKKFTLRRTQLSYVKRQQDFRYFY